MLKFKFPPPSFNDDDEDDGDCARHGRFFPPNLRPPPLHTCAYILGRNFNSVATYKLPTRTKKV